MAARAAASAESATSVEYVDARGTYWAEFTKPPTICNGFVTMAGELKNGATFASSNWYRIHARRHRNGPTASHSSRHWNPESTTPELYEGEQAAATHTAAPASPGFELVAAIPPRFETFDGLEIAIWGYVPAGYEGPNPSGGATTLLREATVPRC